MSQSSGVSVEGCSYDPYLHSRACCCNIITNTSCVNIRPFCFSSKLQSFLYPSLHRAISMLNLQIMKCRELTAVYPLMCLLLQLEAMPVISLCARGALLVCMVHMLGIPTIFNRNKSLLPKLCLCVGSVKSNNSFWWFGHSQRKQIVFGFTEYFQLYEHWEWFRAPKEFSPLLKDSIDNADLGQ